VRVLLPLPDRDFDVTEVAVPWAILRDAGHEVPRLAVLSERVGRFWRLNRPVGAICHGVLVLARTRDPAAGRSVLADRRTTCLPKYMERSAYLATGWRLGRYYRTYPAYVEDEVRAALADPDAQFERGPVTLSARGTASDDRPAFVVHDRNYVSARWPGDAYLFGRAFRDLLESGSLSRTNRVTRPGVRLPPPADRARSCER
jgi:putative intracellular protease/amidase